MDLRRQLSIIRHWKWLLVASTLLAGGTAFLVSTVLPKTYEGTTTLNVGQSLSAVNPDYSALLASQRLSQTYADVATTRPILEKVIAKVGLGITADELFKRVSADALRDSTLIRVVATDGDPNRAAAIANAIADELIAASPGIQGRAGEVQKFVDAELRSLQSQIESTQGDVTRLSGLPARSASEEQDLQSAQSRLVTLRSTYATLLSTSSNSSSNLLTQIEPAVPPQQAASPRPLLNTILAAMLGLLIAMGIVFLIEYLDDTVKSAEDVDATVALPTLGGIARMKGDEKRSEIYHLVTLLYPRSPIAEAYRTLRTNTEFAMVDAPARTLLVTSSVPGEGKTTTAANLAVAFAQAGRRTLLLDADLRKPGVHRLFDLPNAYGLSTLFRSEQSSLEQLVQGTEQEGLSVMTTGPLPPNPAELLRSQRFGAILARLREAFDLVLVDSPPLQAVTDAAILASVTDGTLFVIQAGRTRRGAAMRGREALARANARVFGAVMNRLSERVSNEYYYSSYGAYSAEADAPASVKSSSPVATSGSKPQ